MANKATGIPFGAFRLQSVLGSGTQGQVWAGTHEAVKCTVAIKVLEKRPMKNDPKRMRSMLRELAIVHLIQHPHVVKVYDVMETPEAFGIVMEHVKGGDLFDLISRHGRLEAPVALRILAQLVTALEYCYDHGVAHRDLKPENILVDEQGNVRLCDFGLAGTYSEGVDMKGEPLLMSTFCGSPNYAAPEIVLARPYDPRQRDVWSLGIILYAMVTGCLPFSDENINVLFALIARGTYQFPEGMVLDLDVLDLISRMLVVDPSHRITFAEMRLHPAFARSRVAFPEQPVKVKKENIEPLPAEAVDECLLVGLEALGYGTVKELRTVIFNAVKTVPAGMNVDRCRCAYTTMLRVKHARRAAADAYLAKIRQPSTKAVGRFQVSEQISEESSSSQPCVLEGVHDSSPMSSQDAMSSSYSSSGSSSPASPMDSSSDVLSRQSSLSSLSSGSLSSSIPTMPQIKAVDLDKAVGKLKPVPFPRRAESDRLHRSWQDWHEEPPMSFSFESLNTLPTLLVQ